MASARVNSNNNSGGMLRARRRDICIKPNRKLDRKSSRGMIYENEELRLRTIHINAEVEQGQSDIKKLRRENEQLRKEIWCLRDEYDRLEELLKRQRNGELSCENDESRSVDEEELFSELEEEDEEQLENFENQKISSEKMCKDAHRLQVDFNGLSVVKEEDELKNNCNNNHRPDIVDCPLARSTPNRQIVSPVPGKCLLCNPLFLMHHHHHSPSTVNPCVVQQQPTRQLPLAATAVRLTRSCHSLSNGVVTRTSRGGKLRKSASCGDLGRPHNNPEKSDETFTSELQVSLKIPPRRVNSTTESSCDYQNVSDINKSTLDKLGAAPKLSDYLDVYSALSRDTSFHLEPTRSACNVYCASPHHLVYPNATTAAATCCNNSLNSSPKSCRTCLHSSSENNPSYAVVQRKAAKNLRLNTSLNNTSINSQSQCGAKTTNNDKDSTKGNRSPASCCSSAAGQDSATPIKKEQFKRVSLYFNSKRRPTLCSLKSTRSADVKNTTRSSGQSRKGDSMESTDNDASVYRVRGNNNNNNLSKDKQKLPRKNSEKVPWCACWGNGCI